MAITTVFLTTVGTNNWTVPADWHNGQPNSVEVIGAGGKGGQSTNGSSSPGGGGGGYGKKNNLTLTPGASISYTIAAGNSGNDSYFNGASLSAAPVGATAGSNGTAGATSQSGASGGTGKGDVTYTGGRGADASGSPGSGGGGGGAAGLNGNGSAASGLTGGSGDNGNGGGGGGAGGNGASGTEYSSSPTYGSGGGGGSTSTGAVSGNGGLYGAAGGGSRDGGGGNEAGSGTQALIVITYTSQVAYSLSVLTGAFAVTAHNAIVSKVKTMIVNTGVFIVSRFPASLKKTLGWKTQSKSSSTNWTPQQKS